MSLAYIWCISFTSVRVQTAAELKELGSMSSIIRDLPHLSPWRLLSDCASQLSPGPKV